VKPAKRRAASEVELDVPNMFGTNGWSTAPSPGSTSAITDDEFNLEMQRFMSLLPLSLDEHNWNVRV
jgi:transcription factor MYB, plant